MGRRQITPDEDLRRRMCIKRLGGNIAAAARELDIPIATLQRYAQDRGLNRKGRGINTLLPLEEVMRRVKAWLVCGSDREAAKMLGMKVYTFTRWRVRHRLPGKNYKGGRL